MFQYLKATLWTSLWTAFVFWYLPIKQYFQGGAFRRVVLSELVDAMAVAQANIVLVSLVLIMANIERLTFGKKGIKYLPRMDHYDNRSIIWRSLITISSIIGITIAVAGGELSLLVIVIPVQVVSVWYLSKPFRRVVRRLQHYGATEPPWALMLAALPFGVGALFGWCYLLVAWMLQKKTLVNKGHIA